MDVVGLIDRLGSAARVETYETDTIIFCRGDATHHMFGVLAGEACLRRDSVEGTDMMIHRARVGEFFAEAALFSDAYHCDGEAVSGSRIAWLPKNALRKLIREDGIFAMAFCQRLASQVQRLRSNIELRSIRAAEDRVMAALSLRVSTGQRHLDLDGTWKSFAQDIGLTHEALYRALRRLQDGGRLVRDGKSVRLGREVP